MDFGLFDTWNALYAGGTVPWDSAYSGGELLESEAYTKNFEQVDAVEEMGWDYIWLGGGHFSRQASMDPQVLMLAAVIAARTKRIKIGSSIHRPLMKLAKEELSERALPHERYAFDNLMLDDPFQTAEQVSIVDQVSQGRFIYGAGARSRGSDERRDYFFEFLEVMKQLWTEDHFSGFEGKYYNYPAFYEQYLSIPKPYQKPYPPMLLPVDSQESFIPMGKMGYKIAIGAGSSTHNLRGTTVLLEDVKSYRKAWYDAGHAGEPSTVVRIPTLLADTTQEAERLSDELMVLAKRYFSGRIGIGSTDAGSASPETTAEVNLFGTAEEVVDKIEVLREQYSTDEIMFEVNWTSSVPRDVVMNTMRILTDKVIPKFK
ncbi:MAG: LLM class flavin-dependent oxidoreductase [Chloroflexi bacterium]|nr:LLM class flavin-dependent oxidoreductase [Chloroflexota bacterium]MCI0847704.1 LLM class flavin-dependent oxidoreductase [Chloroflexota bacterium]MCI0898271.1 LLM class flavin-dependent oxidoreductase [Chloroflexota bacterium]